MVQMNIFEEIIQLQRENKSAALVTVIKTRGSVPRESGSKMLVQADGTIHGTIGGGSVENMVINEALQVLKSGKAVTVKHDLFDEDGKDTGMVCGGNMEFFIEPVAAAEKIYIFGGGHIAFHLAGLAGMMEFNYLIIDDRKDFANKERFPGALECINNDAGEAAANISFDANDYIVIISRDHNTDYEILKQVLHKPARYLGMIGSKSKRRDIYKRLKQNDGFSDDDLQRIHSPIGLDIGAETPQEIALSIMAEIIKEKRTS